MDTYEYISDGAIIESESDEKKFLREHPIRQAQMNKNCRELNKKMQKQFKDMLSKIS